MSKKRRGILSSDDRALWQALTKTVRPLDNRPSVDNLDAKADQQAKTLRYKVRFEGPRPVRPMVDERPREQGPISRKQHRRLAKGQRSIDGVLDLHGLSQEQAFQTLISRIPAARASGARCLLVVTGKGSARFAQTHAVPVAQRKYHDFQHDGGVLKRMVPEWLRSAELSAHVSGFEASHKSHGGEGALYVMLRRVKP